MSVITVPGVGEMRPLGDDADRVLCDGRGVHVCDWERIDGASSHTT